MGFAIRAMTEADRPAWIRLRRQLWPGPAAGHSDDTARMLAEENVWAFLAEGMDNEPLGFAELALRPYANGLDSRPVPFLEGIFVASPYRRQGIGRALLAHVEDFVRARGFTELGSDTEEENRASQTAHRAWGFQETERVVYFRKRL